MNYDKNYYLKLLKEQIRVIEEKLKLDVNNPLLDIVLAGIVIQMNAILEQCFLDFHSDDFKDFANKLYNFRQSLIHYLDYSCFENIKEKCNDLVNEFNKVYPKEKKFFNAILSNNYEHKPNVVIKKGKNIIYDEYLKSYRFSNDNVTINISNEKVIELKRRSKTVAYIVNCNNSLLYSYKDNDDIIYKELDNKDEIQTFFIDNFNVIGKDLKAHVELINDIVDKFYSDVQLKSSFVVGKDDKFFSPCSKVFSNYLYNNSIDSELLSGYSFMSRDLQDNIKEYNKANFKYINDEIILDNISIQDFFFINKTISKFSKIESLVSNEEITKNDLINAKIFLLINWLDHSVLHYGKELVECDPNFNSLYLKLVAYRNFFAHNIRQLDPKFKEKRMEEFYTHSKEFVAYLNSLKIKNITKQYKNNSLKVIGLEKSKNNFINYKYAQYVKIEPFTYVGEKLYYSKKNNSDKVIALMIADKNSQLQASYYEYKNNEFKQINFKNKRNNKKSPYFVSEHNFLNGTLYNIDTDFTAFFEAYAYSKNKLECDKKVANMTKLVVVFKDGSYGKEHAIKLDNLIDDFYQKRYIPIELLNGFKLVKNLNDNGKYEFKIIDNYDNHIADIVEEYVFKKYSYNVDSRNSFSLNNINCTVKRK